MFTVTFDLLFVIAVVGGALALLDAILRVRGRGSILAVIQIIAAALFLLSLFFTGIPWGPPTLAIVTAVLLVVGLIVRGGTRRGSIAVTVIALILLLLWLLLQFDWIVIPGVNA